MDMYFTAKTKDAKGKEVSGEAVRSFPDDLDGWVAELGEDAVLRLAKSSAQNSGNNVVRNSISAKKPKDPQELIDKWTPGSVQRKSTEDHLEGRFDELAQMDPERAAAALKRLEGILGAANVDAATTAQS